MRVVAHAQALEQARAVAEARRVPQPQHVALRACRSARGPRRRRSRAAGRAPRRRPAAAACARAWSCPRWYARRGSGSTSCRLPGCLAPSDRSGRRRVPQRRPRSTLDASASTGAAGRAARRDRRNRPSGRAPPRTLATAAPLAEPRSMPALRAHPRPRTDPRRPARAVASGGAIAPSQSRTPAITRAVVLVFRRGREAEQQHDDVRDRPAALGQVLEKLILVAVAHGRAHVHCQALAQGGRAAVAAASTTLPAMGS